MVVPRRLPCVVDPPPAQCVPPLSSLKACVVAYHDPLTPRPCPQRVGLRECQCPLGSAVPLITAQVCSDMFELLAPKCWLLFWDGRVRSKAHLNVDFFN